VTIDSAQKVEYLYQRLHALVLGGIDMHDVLETATYLLGEHSEAPGHDGGMPWRARRTLETGIFVTYARPFTETRRPGLPHLKRARGLSPEQRESHAEILSRRHQVYAHTDDTPLRQVLQLADSGERAAWVREQDALSEQWFPPTRDMLTDVAALAAAHLDSFLEEIEKVRTAILAEVGAAAAVAAVDSSASR
jgi:hypothetical protein